MNTHTAFDPHSVSPETRLPELLAEAGRRLRRQSRYAKPLARRGKRAAALEEVLDRAQHCILELSHPGAVVKAVASEPVAGGMRVAGRVEITGEGFQRDAEAGAQVSLYLLTLGYDQQAAFAWLEKDYVAHHMQSDLATEVLFALGRQTFATQKASVAEGRRIRRVSIQTDDICGQKNVWDVAKVQALLGGFGEEDLGVSVTDTGCFLPLYSLLGLTIEV